VLGDDDEARRFSDQRIEIAESSFDRQDTVRAYIDLNTDRAVEIAFGELARDPNWDGFDEFAAHYAFHMAFVVHPRVQEYYLREGKWIDYLAARVPEYAKHRRTAAD